MDKITGYELSRSFFDWSYENVGKVKPVHVALYFFAIEHCNRLGWKSQFGMPTQMSMDAIGIKNWKTYSAAFNDLEEWGFFRVVERSKNQYSATVIALVKNTKALSKALSKASQKHYQKHCPEQVQSIVGIDKLNNQEQRTVEQENTSPPEKSLEIYATYDTVKKATVDDEIFIEQGAMAAGGDKEPFKRFCQTKLDKMRASGKVSTYTIASIRGFMINDFEKEPIEKKKGIEKKRNYLN